MPPQLAQFILAGPGLFLQLVGLLVAETFHFVPQLLDGALQLAGLVMSGGWSQERPMSRR